MRQTLGIQPIDSAQPLFCHLLKCSTRKTAIRYENFWIWDFEISKKKYFEWENLDPSRNVELTETSGRITVKLTSEFTPNKYVSDIQPNNWCHFLKSLLTRFHRTNFDCPWNPQWLATSLSILNLWLRNWVGPGTLSVTLHIKFVWCLTTFQFYLVMSPVF